MRDSDRLWRVSVSGEEMVIRHPRVEHCWRFAVAVALAIGLDGAAAAQNLRYEMGARLRGFERTFERLDSPAVRQATVGHLERAVQSYFSMSMAGAARHLDEARAAILDEAGSALFRRIANVCLVPKSRLVDGAATELEYAIDRFYGEPLWDGLTLVLNWRPAFASQQRKVVGPPIDSIRYSLTNQRPQTCRLPIARLPEGDYLLTIDVTDGANQVQVAEQVFSVVHRLPDRVEHLRQARDEGFGALDATYLETWRWNLRLIEAALDGETAETDFPLARMLSACEHSLEAFRAGQSVPAPAWQGPQWIMARHGNRRLPLRFQAPADAVPGGPPRPLLVLCHGAGGSENMFFDGYGDGKAIQMALERGWLVAAPRGGFGSIITLDQIVEELDKFHAVDRNAVMMIGHSMGAGAAMTYTMGAERKPLAVAPVGGGGAADPERCQGVSFFVAAGQQDIGKAGARRLADRLKQGGLPVIYREYEHIEHLAIVQAALDEIFAFFDACLSKKEIEKDRHN